jgi:hypothetical protein
VRKTKTPPLPHGTSTDDESYFMGELYDGKPVGIWAHDVSAEEAVARRVAPRVEGVRLSPAEAGKHGRRIGIHLRPGWYARSVDEAYLVNVYGPYKSIAAMVDDLGLGVPPGPAPFYLEGGPR